MRYTPPTVGGLVTVKVTWSGLREMVDGFGSLGREQLPFATALALTRTARRGKGLMYAEFRKKFDKPIPFLMSGERNPNDDRVGVLWVDQATKERLSSAFYLKTEPLGKKNPYSIEDILRHHFIGGGRVPKVFELVLRRLGYLKSDEWIRPMPKADIDPYGNLSQGQIGRILSQLRINKGGYDNAPTDSRRSRANVAKSGEMFWSFGVGSPGPWAYKGKLKFEAETGRYRGRLQHLPKGLFIRRGDNVDWILAVTKAPTYSARISMQELAQRAVDVHFAKEFEVAFDQAVRSAGKLKAGSSREERVADFRDRAYR